MKIFTGIEQGSDAWHKLRLGIPTASQFHKIVTPKKAGLSAGAHEYALRLVAERLLNMSAAESLSGLQWMDRGKELEPMAVRQYEFQNEVVTVPVGFITTDDGTLGCSPDRLVVDGDVPKLALEVKCPSQHVHLGYLLDGTTDDYKPQVMGQILVAELDRADLYSYHPQMPPALIRTTRDEPYLEKLAAALRAFTDILADMSARAQALGAFQPVARAVTPSEIREIDDLQREFRKVNEARFVKEGFTL